MEFKKKLAELAKIVKAEAFFFPTIQTGDDKLKADGIRHFTIPAGITCPGAGACNGIGDGDLKAFCYAQHGRYVTDVVMKAHLRNLYATKSEHFVPLMIRELYASSHSVKVRYIRIHTAGDFYSLRYIDDWAKILVGVYHLPLKFYAYTKAFAVFDLSPLWACSNLNLIQSTGSLDDSRIDYNRPHARIFRNLKDLTKAGYVDCSISDLPAALGAVKVGLIVNSLTVKKFSHQDDVKTRKEKNQP